MSVCSNLQWNPFMQVALKAQRREKEKFLASTMYKHLLQLQARKINYAWEGWASARCRLGSWPGAAGASPTLHGQSARRRRPCTGKAGTWGATTARGQCSCGGRRGRMTATASPWRRPGWRRGRRRTRSSPPRPCHCAWPAGCTWTPGCPAPRGSAAGAPRMTHRLLLPLSLPLPGRGRLSGARGACTARRGRRRWPPTPWPSRRRGGCPVTPRVTSRRAAAELEKLESGVGLGPNGLGTHLSSRILCDCVYWHAALSNRWSGSSTAALELDGVCRRLIGLVCRKAKALTNTCPVVNTLENFLRCRA